MATGKTRFLSGLLGLHSELERMIHDVDRGAKGSGARGRWRPASDVFVSGGNVVMRFEVAGVRREDIDLSYRDGHLVVRGARLESESEPKEGYWQMEIPHGPFERRIKIPLPVDPDRIEAVCRAGLLEVRMPILSKKNSTSVRID